MSSKYFISAESLRIDSYKLAALVLKSGFKPDFIVALWRGGAPIGCYMHEFFKLCGIKPDHIAIRTSRYKGINETMEEVQVHNLGYLLERLKKDSRVLIIDDVHETGLSVKAVLDTLRNNLKDDYPNDIREATVYFKPDHNKTNPPDYYLHTSSQWLVFPHELEGLTLEEMDGQVVKLLESFDY